MPEVTDLVRLRAEYSDRERRLAGSDRYSLFNLPNLFTIQQRQRAILGLLRLEGLYPLNERQILEVGCGAGGVLLEYLSYGAHPARLLGCDLLPKRLAEAQILMPHLALVNADGQNLPYIAQTFDLVIQSTVFSSILDDAVKRNVADEMLRVCKPGGMILWYDFWLNPTNRQTRGIRPAEIRRLFPGCCIRLYKVTLAPPLVRRLIGVSWIVCALLEKIKVFNTHYLAAIHPVD